MGKLNGMDCNGIPCEEDRVKYGYKYFSELKECERKIVMESYENSIKQKATMEEIDDDDCCNKKENIKCETLDGIWIDEVQELSEEQAKHLFEGTWYRLDDKFNIKDN